MATTEAPAAGRARGLRAGLIALLAGAYLGALWAFTGQPPSHAAAAAPTHDAAAAQGRQSATTAPVWYQDLPPSQRPTVPLPAGWRIADRSARPEPSSVSAAPTVKAKATPVRPYRIRTRSS